MNPFYIKLRVAIIPSAFKRTTFLVKHNIFKMVGKNFYFQPRKIPQDPKFIIFHDNVCVASNVTFITHDGINKVFNNLNPNKKCNEYYGCIEIMDNVFIGANSTILSNVRIGPNVIVAAGSVITKDVPANSIVGGVSGQVIGDFSKLYERRMAKSSESISALNKDERAVLCWKEFFQHHDI